MGIFKKVNEWQEKRRKDQEYRNSPEYAAKVLAQLKSQNKIAHERARLASINAQIRKANQQGQSQQSGFGAGLANFGGGMFGMGPTPQPQQAHTQNSPKKKKKKKRMMVVYGYPGEF